MKLRAMVVDDSGFMRMTVRSIVQRLGHEVIGEADNGQNAVAAYAELRPDVVMMDMSMPQMDGLDALAEIRKQFPEAKVIMVSAVGQEQFIRRAMDLGARGYLVKPVDDSEMSRALEALN